MPEKTFKKWEYKTVNLIEGLTEEVEQELQPEEGLVEREDFGQKVLACLVEHLNQLGQEGWELAGVFPDGTGIFKRPVV